MKAQHGRLDGGFWLWLVVASLVRAPVLMSAVAFTSIAALVLDDPDRGGVLAGASVLGMLLGTPVSIAAQRVLSAKLLLTLQLTICALSWAALAVTLHLPISVWLAIAVIAGISMAGSAGLIRSTMSELVPADLQARASTIDALAQDALVFLAPMLVAVGLGFGAPGAPLAVAVVAIVSIIGVNVHARGGSARNRPDHPGGEPASARRRPIGRWSVWAFMSLGVGMALGAVEAGAVGLAVRLGLPVESAWLLFLVLAASSAVGAWVDIAWLQERMRSARPPVLIAVFGGGTALLSMEPRWSTVLLGLVLVGLPTAAVLGLRSHVFDGDPAADRRTGLTLSFAAQGIGFATGAALLAVTGQSGALLLSAGIVLLGGIAAVFQLRAAEG